MSDTVDDPATTEPDTTQRPRSAADFRAFVEPHWATMARFARGVAPHESWEDVLQDALTTAWRKRRQFDPDKGTSRNWLLSIIADKAYKRRRRRTPPTLPLLDVAAGNDRTTTLDVRRAVHRLAPRQRTAITLRYYLGLSIDETAAVMNCSPGTVKSTVSDAKRQLKSILGKDYDSD